MYSLHKLTTWNILGEFIKQYPGLFTIYCVLILGMPINDVVLPQLYGKVLGGLKTKTPIKQYIFPIIALLILVQVLYFSNDLLEINLYPKMHAFLRDITLDYVVRTKSTNLSEIESGKLIAKLIRFPSVYSSFMDDFRNAIVPYFLIYTIVMGYMFYIDKYLGGLIAVIFGSVFGLTFLSMMSCNKYSQKRDVLYYKLFDHVDEILRNIVSVLNNNRYEDEKTHLDAFQNEYVHYCSKALWCVMKYKVMMFVIFVGVIYLFVTRCIELYLRGKLSHAVVISVAIIILFMFGTLMKHAGLFKDLMYRYGTITECLMMFNEGIDDKHIENVSSKLDMKSNSPFCLAVENVGYSYDGKKQTLRDISFRVKCHENIAIVGHIGSGKSTLMKLLMKYKSPSQGELYLNGIPYSKLPEDEVRAKIGYTAQNSILFNRSIMENIRYSNKNASAQDIINMIHRYGLDDFFKRFPMGLETKAGINGSNLSGGEKQIIWILRVILQNPQMILLDEPTSAMDDATKEYILRLLLMVTKEKTVLCITHDTNVLKYFDRVLYLKNGELVGEKYT